MISPCYSSIYAKNIVNLNECVAAIAFYNRKRVIHQIGDWNWNCELTLYLSNTLYIRNAWLHVRFKKKTLYIE